MRTSVNSEELPLLLRPALLAVGNRLAYRGPHFEAPTHASTLDVVLVALDGTLDIQTPEGNLAGVQVALVPSGVQRRYVLCAPHVAVLWVDRRDALVPALKLEQADGRLRGGDAPWLREELMAPDALHTLKFGLRPSLDPLIDQLFAALDREEGPERGIDELARELGVSQWHLMRTLKKETGSTFRQYRLLRRLTKAILSYARWGSWTPAALEAGFSSPSHFSDSFRMAFGLSATQLLQGRSFGSENEAPPVGAVYKAASLVTVRNMVRARGAELTTLPPADAATFRSLAPGDWVPYELATRIYDAASTALYDGPMRVESLGRDLARDHLHGRYRTVVGPHSLEALVGATPTLWRLYNSVGALEVAQRAPRQLRFTVVDFPTYGEVMSRSLAGYIAGSVEQAVGTPVTTSRHVEGERQHIDATW
ncbi:MAG: AraC family transcriptional regulator [Archangium sp.]|nr:AraC family transcriptional regulator [Archangium sp.]MDP3155267.1 AraC family transcriptional regulator [Archangium sp.]MDP3570928.1 AraC family transcriptional regulator [Archangium sp.]